MSQETQEQFDKAIWESIGFKDETAFVQALCIRVKLFVGTVNKDTSKAIDYILEADRLANYYLLICGSGHDAGPIIEILGKPGKLNEHSIPTT